MAQHTYISIPASTADKLAALGRAMLDLAKEMKEHAGKREAAHGDLHDIPADQRWFWTPQWQAMEREADADIAAGRVVTFDTAEDAVSYLQQL